MQDTSFYLLVVGAIVLVSVLVYFTYQQKVPTVMDMVNEVVEPEMDNTQMMSEDAVMEDALEASEGFQGSMNQQDNFEDVATGAESNQASAPANVANNAPSNNQLPSECYPKDVLTSADLLPRDANSLHAQVVPSGQGALSDQNFLTAGYHIGINTVGQTLRNANRQLRSEPANPQSVVSPWLNSTIEPDINRRPLEIGSQ